MAAINYELTERAARVFLAARGDGKISFSTDTSADAFEMPALGDEMEFPSITGNVVFTVIRRRFRMQEGHEIVTILWLDAPENAAAPVASDKI